MTFIGKNLRYLRKQAGLSQQELASNIGLNRGNIASYEKGVAEPKSTNMLKIAKFFQVDVNDFIEADLNDEVENKNLKLSHNDNKISIQKESLSEVVCKVTSESNSTLKVIAENSAEIEKIVEGLRNFNNYRQAKMQEENYDLDPLIVVYDYIQLLEITEDLIDLNRQLLILANNGN